MKVPTLLKQLVTSVWDLIRKTFTQSSKVYVAKMVIQNAEKLSDRQTEAICKMMR